MQGRVGILRVGQLCGDTQTGWWNEKEGWPLLIRTGDRTGCLPELDEVSTPHHSRVSLSLSGAGGTGRSFVCSGHASEDLSMLCGATRDTG